MATLVGAWWGMTQGYRLVHRPQQNDTWSGAAKTFFFDYPVAVVGLGLGALAGQAIDHTFLSLIAALAAEHRHQRRE